MRTLPVAPTQLAPLERDAGDGIGRIARRTQRGQGGRRLLVAGLIALSVLLGVASAIFAATMLRSDETVGVQDRFGDAAALVVAHESGMQFEESGEPTVADLTEQQRAWLEEHRLDGELPTPPERPWDVPREVQQALGVEPVTVPPSEILPQMDLGAEDVLVARTGETYDQPSGQQLRVTTLDPTHPLAGTTYDTGDRTEPLTGRQGLLSPSLLTALDAEIGDTVELPAVGPVEVVGTATRSYARSQQLAIVAPDRQLQDTADFVQTEIRFADEDDARAYSQVADELAQDKIAALPDPTPEQAQTLGMPPDDAEFSQPYATGTGIERRQDYLSRFVSEQSLPTLVGGTVTALATVVAAVVGACAFAVGVRRRIREIGMLGAIGTTPAQLRRLLRREGLVIGLGGAAAGAVGGLAVAYAGQPLVERFVDRDVSIVIPVVGALLPVIVGGLGAYLAAVWPARTAARVPITTALAGRVPLGRVPRWLPVTGAAAAAAGVALLAELVTGNTSSTGFEAVQLLAAVLLATLGAAALGVPIIAAGGRIADRLPLLGRLALRDAARQRTRSAAAVAALVPVLAIPVAAGGVILSEHARGMDGGAVVAQDGTVLEMLPYEDRGGSTYTIVYGPQLQGRMAPPSQDTIDAIAAELPPIQARAPITYLGTPDLPPTASAVLPRTDDGRIDPDQADPTTLGRLGPAWSGRLTLATPQLLDLLELPDDAVPTDGALVFDDAGGPTLPDDVPTLLVAQPDAITEPGPRDEGQPWRTLGELTVFRDQGTVTGGLDLGALITPDTAERLGLVETARSEILRLAAVPSQAQATAVYSAVDGTTGRGVSVSPAPPFWTTPLGRTLIVAAAVLAATLVVSLVAGMTSALAATESDTDVRKAVALGARPSLRRRLHGLQAWWHTAIAAVLGSALGLAVAWAIVRSITVVTEYGPNGEVLEQTRGTLAVHWLGLAGWIVVLPILVGLVIATAMRSAPVGAPRRRTA